MLLITAVLFSCQQNYKTTEAAEASPNLLSTKPTLTNERQFIHAASIDMDTKNCLQTTNLIEANVLSNKGFILKSSVEKNIHSETESPISTDSLKRLTYFNMMADIVVRVPDTSLQNFLNYTQSLGLNVKTRIISATDVTFDLKLNELNLGSNVPSKVLAKADDEVTIIDAPLSKNEMVVNNMKLKDAVRFSTINIKLCEPQALESQTVINSSASWAKEASLASKAWLSIQKGFYYCTSILIFVLQLWWLIPLFFIGRYLIVKKNIFLLKPKVK
jgi:hypothetical protein